MGYKVESYRRIKTKKLGGSHRETTGIYNFGGFFVVKIVLEHYII